MIESSESKGLVLTGRDWIIETFRLWTGDPVRGHIMAHTIVAGAVIVGVALTADYLGLGTGGRMGSRQVLLMYLGLSLVLSATAFDLIAGKLSGIKFLLGSMEARHYALSLVQLGFLCILIRQFQLVSTVFYSTVVILVLLGFVAQYFLSERLRIPFFVLLSFLSILEVVGLEGGCWLIGIGLVLIAICHVPVRFAYRLALLVLVGGTVALFRTNFLASPWDAAIWPILGSMFMFRLIVYFYDIQHKTAPLSPAKALAYFFLIPNVVFPLFPVIDYARFSRDVTASERSRLHQRGINWIFRGMTHLLFYRLVYHYLSISTEQVTSLPDLAVYLFSNFSLYLKVSGQFHLAVGTILLFGFDLPETNHLYGLARGFNDFWRRINIYWKDFMMKVFYYPSYFRLRRLGNTWALSLSTAVVFAVTWFLHSYQWFWLRGSFPVSSVDVAFWGILGILVLANSLYEERYGRKRRLGSERWNVKVLVREGVKIGATMTTICVLWSLWTSSSLSEWLSLWKVAGTWNASGKAVNLVAVEWILALGAIALLVGLWRKYLASRGVGIAKEPVMTASGLILLCVIVQPSVSGILGVRAQRAIRDLQVASLNQRDAALLQRGYYENLMGVDRFNSQLWEIYMNRDTNWLGIPESLAVQWRDDVLRYELIPLSSVPFKGARLTTNRWGMRDQSYTLTKPAHTFRIALLGGSHTMGSGVKDDETFDTLLERKLNKSGPPKSGLRFEVLNFGVGGYGPLQRLRSLEIKALRFTPDLSVYIAHDNDFDFAVRDIQRSVKMGVPIPYDFINKALRELGIDQTSDPETTERKLNECAPDLVGGIYERFVDTSREHGSVPVWVLLPSLESRWNEEETQRLRHLAQRAGFFVIDISNAFAEENPDSLKIAPWDWHPNATGHKLLANRLYLELMKDWPELTASHQHVKSTDAALRSRSESANVPERAPR